MKTKLPQLLAVALASCALTALTYAEDAKPEHKDKGPSKADLKKYDANKDGQLDDAEKAAMKADKESAKKARLDKYDADKDGKMSKAERDAEKADKKAEKESKKADKQH